MSKNTIKQPLVTAIIPSYNHSGYVKYAINSVLEQSYENLELVIIDDGSKDDSVNVINECLCQIKKSHCLKNIRFIHRENRGLCNTLNQALDVASGEYVVIMASDDIMLKNAVKIMVDKITTDASIAGVVGNYIEMDSENRYIPVWIYRLFSKGLAAKTITFEGRFTLADRYAGPASLFNKEALVKVGGYRADLMIEDYYIQLKLLDSGYKLFRMNEYTLLYRVHNSNTSLQVETLLGEAMKIRRLYAERPNYDELMEKLSLNIKLEKSHKEAILKSNSGSKLYIRNIIKNILKRKYY